MAKNGGARPGSGRKSKAEEAALVERLTPMDDIALKELKKGITGGDYQFIKMFFEYRFGKPKEKVEHSGEMSLLWNEIRNYGADTKTDESS